MLAAVYERDYADGAGSPPRRSTAYRSLGEVERVVRELEREMREAAARLDFERAAALRDRVRGLKELELAVGVGAGAARRGGRAGGRGRAPAARRRRRRGGRRG